MLSSETECAASTLSHLFGVTQRRIQQLAKDDIIPKNGHGRYPYVESIQAYIRYLQSGYDENGAADYHEEKARLTKLQADEKDLAVKTLRGQLIPIERAEALMTQAIMNARAKLLAMPTTLAPQLQHVSDLNKIHTILKDSIYEALTELADNEFTSQDSESDTESD